jgi:hypothetical protein
VALVLVEPVRYWNCRRRLARPGWAALDRLDEG